MKVLVRIVLSLFAVLVSYLLVLNGFSHEFRKTEKDANLLALAIALTMGTLLWKVLKNTANSLPAYILAGGILVGITGFILGFFGPLLLSLLTWDRCLAFL